MIKNRTAQIIYQTIYCTLGFVGLIACLGIFDDINTIRWDFYVHFTNQSNFLCIGVMLTALVQTAKKKKDGYVTAVPMLKFISMLGILLTFLVFKAIPHNSARAICIKFCVRKRRAFAGILCVFQESATNLLPKILAKCRRCNCAVLP